MMILLLRQTLGFIVLASLMTGIAYPFAITAIGGTLFADQAAGSLVRLNGRVIGSQLIGQPFSADTHFHSRPSLAGSGYDATRSGGSNLSTGNPLLIDAIRGRVASERHGDAPLPADLAMASASGLDPHLSPAAALYQVPRIAAARGLPKDQVEALVRQHIEPRQLGFLGEPRVNVLALNLALDSMQTPTRTDPTTGP